MGVEGWSGAGSMRHGVIGWIVAVMAACRVCTLRGLAYIAVTILLSTPAQAAIIQGSIVNPATPSYNDLGTWSFTSGTLTINTNTLAISHSGGFSGTGNSDVSQSGNVILSVFSFDQLSIGPGVTVVVTGEHGLVLASRGNMTFNTTLDLSGTAAFHNSTHGFGGTGAEGGSRNVNTQSAPQGPFEGNGGFGGTTSDGQTGVGFGAGSKGVTTAAGGTAGGGGGSYGGRGGTGAQAGTNATPGTGGSTYGTLAVDDLFGGSGAGGSANVNNLSSVAAGGGGGGAFSLVARGTLSIGSTGQLISTGGAGGLAVSGNPGGGGGGSGGGVLLAADTLDLHGTINVRGGEAGGEDTSTNDRPGGGGGGGRIALYYNTLSQDSSLVPGANVLIDGGITHAGGIEADASAGGAGTLYQAAPPAYLVPEPSLLAWFGMIVLILIGRQRSQSPSNAAH
jgi:hypothetical protein